jgi:hypothetical protein
MALRDDLNALLAKVYDTRNSASREGAIAACCDALAKDSNLYQCAESRRSELRAVIALRRQCHISKSYLDILEEVLKDAKDE